MNPPAVMALHPAGNRLKIGLPGLSVTEHTVLRALHQRILHIGRGSKIHVCDPEREHILRQPPALCEVIFQAVCISAVNVCVKIEISLRHHQSSVCSCMYRPMVQPPFLSFIITWILFPMREEIDTD